MIIAIGLLGAATAAAILAWIRAELELRNTKKVARATAEDRDYWRTLHGKAMDHIGLLAADLRDCAEISTQIRQLLDRVPQAAAELTSTSEFSVPNRTKPAVTVPVGPKSIAEGDREAAEARRLAELRTGGRAPARVQDEDETIPPVFDPVADDAEEDHDMKREYRVEPEVEDPHRDGDDSEP